LIGIAGVPKPEPVAKKVGEKVAEAVKEAAEAAKTVLADTDDTQEHNEL
jgi:FK506-binding protein 2